MTDRPREEVKLWTLDTPWGGVDLLRARYVTQNFSRHSHRRYGVGVIEAGAMGFDYRGRGQVAPAGSINLVIPDEVHNGRATSEIGWTYRMFYLPPRLMALAGGRPSQALGGPVITAGVVDDVPLAARLRHLHTALERGDLARLEAESELLACLDRLVTGHADEAKPKETAARPGAATEARDYLAAHLADDISLADLAGATGMSPFHLSRIFRQSFGLPPHAWLLQARVRRAGDLMRSGLPPLEAAYRVGFCDQSHLNRRFKAVYGVTPGVLSKIVQD